MRALAFLALLLLPLALGGSLAAQTVGERRQPAGEGSLQVWLITFGEGELYWEKYGHNALWFRDTTQGIDAAYNWGMFDFASPGFLRRLLTGDMQYWVEGVPGRDLIAGYQQRDRTVVVQRLNLTPEQARRIFDLSRQNALDENKFYRYDYFRDNCSTRVRDMIDAAVDGALKRATEGTRVPRTYRTETLRLVDDLKLTQLGIDAALGPPADRPLSAWENAFVPSRLREAVRDLRLARDSGGATVPLVAEERIVYQSATHTERESTPRYSLAYLLIGVFLALELFAAAWAGRRHGLAERVFRFEVGVWSLLTGLLGLILLLAWLITDHVFWYGNRNLLIANPLSLFVAVLAPLSLWRPRFTRPAAIGASVIAALCGIAIVVSAIPSLRQDNASLIFLFVPPHLAVAYGLWSRAGRQLVPSSVRRP